MHFHHHWQGGTITTAMSLTPRLLSPLAGTGRLRRASPVGPRRLLALGAVQPLGQVADGGLERFHFRLQGRFPLHKPRVLRPPVVRLPRELDVGLLRQHHCLLGKGRRASPVHRRKLGSRYRLWQGVFHGLGYSSFFWKVPLFLKGIWVSRSFTTLPPKSLGRGGRDTGIRQLHPLSLSPTPLNA